MVMFVNQQSYGRKMANVEYTGNRLTMVNRLPTFLEFGPGKEVVAP